MSLLINNEMNGGIAEFKISDEELEQTNIADTYIGGVQLITYNSEDEMHASNWKTESSQKDYLLRAFEVITFASGFILFAAGAIFIGSSCEGRHIFSAMSGVFSVLSGSILIGVITKIEVIRRHQSNIEYRTKKIEESEEKLIKHFNRLTTGSFKEIYEKYRYTAFANYSKLEALVRAHLLMPSEAVILNKLFETYSCPEMATKEEMTQLEVAQAAFPELQADLTITRINKVPVIKHKGMPHTDPSDWPLTL